MSRIDTSNEAIMSLAAQLDRETTTQPLADTLRALLLDREMLRGERDSARAMAEDIRLDMQKDMSSLELTIAWLQDEREELRAALLAWLCADDAGDGQECINAIAHARSVVGKARA